MKCLAIVTVLCLVCAFEKASANKQMIKDAAKKCQGDTGASEQDVDDLSDGKLPSTPEGKCLTACVAKQFNIMTAENKLAKDTLLTIAAMKYMGDADKSAKVAEVVDACSEVTHDDECEAAFLISQCIETESKERGLELM